MKSKLFILFLLMSSQILMAQTIDTLRLWPNNVPNETKAKHPAIVTSNNSNNVTRLTDVTDPLLVVYKPKSHRRNGAAVVVCPGGAYNILAINLEGYEIAEWLNKLGYTAFVLQYRVPKKQKGALNDVQRALKTVRSNAPNWKLDPNKIGVMGFSAGGSLSARASTLYTYQSYPTQDASDEASSRPDFTMLIYPAYLDQGPNKSLTPELKVDKNTPPMFIFATSDDRYSNSALVMAGALRDNKVSVELHLLPTGGHGYGLRKGNIAGETWPSLAEKWLENTLAK